MMALRLPTRQPWSPDGGTIAVAPTAATSAHCACHDSRLRGGRNRETSARRGRAVAPHDTELRGDGIALGLSIDLPDSNERVEAEVHVVRELMVAGEIER